MIDATLFDANILVVVFGGLVGLLIGSFLNVVVHRVPIGVSIVAPPSACPRCGSAIRARDNIPVLSWLLLRGKCRDCQGAIAARYPLVELGTGVFFALVAWWVVFTSPVNNSGAAGNALIVLVAFLYLAGVSIALALIDLDTHRLPNVIVLPSYLVGGALILATGVVGGDYGALLRSVIGMSALGGMYLVLALAYPGGMGLGDVKLAGVLGLFLGYLGWGELLVGAFAAFLLGGVFSLGLMALGHATRKSGIPFGPWMLAGAWVGIFFGAALWNRYLTFLGAA